MQSINPKLKHNNTTGACALHPQVVCSINQLHGGRFDVLQLYNSLSPQQITVFELLGRGLVPKEIAGELQCADSTVRTHINRMREKLPNCSQPIQVIAIQCATVMHVWESLAKGFDESEKYAAA
jgi:DNA-binding NarL/FixJ family response regulator